MALSSETRPSGHQNAARSKFLSDHNHAPRKLQVEMGNTDLPGRRQALDRVRAAPGVPCLSSPAGAAAATRGPSAAFAVVQTKIGEFEVGQSVDEEHHNA